MWAVKKVKDKCSNKSVTGEQASGRANAGGGADISLDIVAPVIKDYVWVPDPEKVRIDMKHSKHPTYAGAD